MNILFRCDGSVEIGMGHIVRCVALAEELQETQNCNITFAMRKSELGMNNVNIKYPVIVSNEELFNYENWLSECIEDTDADVLILDARDNLDKYVVKRLKEKYKLLIVDIDDPEEKRLSADLAFYPPVPQVKMMDWSGFKGKLYSGWEYVILRKEFYKEYPRTNNEIPNILVTMGGTDPLNMTKFVVKALDLIEEKFTATILLGPGYKFKEQLNKLLSRVKFKHLVIHSPNNVPVIMAEADFAIASFGVTAYELASLGIPTIFLCISENHKEHADLFNNKGVSVNLGFFKRINKKLLSDEVLDLILKPFAREKMTLNSRKLLRNNGTKLIADILVRKYNVIERK